MMMIENPVLPGFHPDPSICRVGDDYYIASSTFQWFPGVRIHHSRDLVNWRLVGYALTRKSQLDLVGNEDNAGVWAPCLSYQNERFYLVFTNTRSWTGAYKDVHNFLVTALAIEGPWSDPVYLNSSGFDPSLFHDDDGRKWLLNMQWDHRPGRNPFCGILLQQFDEQRGALIGPVRNIFAGTSLGLVEGPHLYKKDGIYYLLTAEGGTSWEHAATIARSTKIDGPYEVMPQNPLITAADDPGLALQRAGHGSLVETKQGQWYLAHLCGRPVMPKRKCILGRETALQPVVWVDGWPRLAHGDNHPRVTVPAPNLPAAPFENNAKQTDFRDDFDQTVMDNGFNSLRVPVTKKVASLIDRPGWLRIFGGESLYSLHHQHLLARRVTYFKTEAACRIDFSPESFQQMAGLIFYYDTTNHHYLRITADDQGRRCLGIITCDGGTQTELDEDVLLPMAGPIDLKGVMDGEVLQYYYRLGDGEWKAVGGLLDATVLSDENKAEVKFTGAFVGMCVQDLTGRRRFADFDWFWQQGHP